MQSEMINQGSWCWMEFYGGADNLQHFYHHLLGWQFNTKTLNNGQGYTTIINNEEEIGGIPENDLNFNGLLCYFTVEDVDKTADLAREHGGTIAVAPMDIPGVGRMAHIIDVSGNRIAVIKFEAHVCG